MDLLKLQWFRIGIAALIVGVPSVIAALIWGGRQPVGMFTPTQWALFGLPTALTWASYQAIPAALDKLHRQGKSITIGKIVTSQTFTLFVRFCGLDHMVMFAGMLVMGLSGHHMHAHGHAHDALVPWVLIVSIWAVAIVSVASAITVNRAALVDLRRP